MFIAITVAGLVAVLDIDHKIPPLRTSTILAMMPTPSNKQSVQKVIDELGGVKYKVPQEVRDALPAAIVELEKLPAWGFYRDLETLAREICLAHAASGVKGSVVRLRDLEEAVAELTQNRLAATGERKGAGFTASLERNERSASAARRRQPSP